MTEGGVQENHKLQLMGYGLILEDIFGVVVQQGFIFLIPRQDVVPVLLDAPLRAKCESALKDIRRIVRDEWMPEFPANRNRCTDCEYRNYCRDMW